MLRHLSGGRYEASTCTSETFAERGIRLAPSMASDHVFGFYEGALAACVTSSCHYPFGESFAERRESADGAEKVV